MSLNGYPHDPATFVTSLDFELHWGVRDVKTVAQYRQNLLGVRRVVPALLAALAEYGIHATWATVGFLFFITRTELLASLPDLRPNYDDMRLSPYLDMKVLGRDEDDDPFHFGRSLRSGLAPDRKSPPTRFSLLPLGARAEGRGLSC